MPDVKEILKKVRKLEIITNRLVDGLVAGNYRSVFRGKGIEFSEVREYVPGDDIRSIDWNVTARLNVPFVKEFIEERDISVFVLFDLSGSSDFGMQKSKKEFAIEVAASLMFAALRNNDNVGLCLFTDRVEKFVSARKGRRHVLKLLRELVYFTPKSRRTDIGGSISYFGRIVKRKSVVFILSDFISSGFENQLRLLKKKHDVVIVRLIDARENDLVDIGYVLLEDEETGNQLLINTADKEFREEYVKKKRDLDKKFESGIRKLGVDMIPIRTDQDFIRPIRLFFRQRRMSR